MSHRYFIRLPKDLAHLPSTNNERRPNAWFREVVVEAAYALSDRVDGIGQLRASALDISALANELEWSWRRLDMRPPSHEDDEELAGRIRATHEAAASDLARCITLIGQTRQQLAAILGVNDTLLREMYRSARSAVKTVFQQAHDATCELGNPHLVALLAVVCDATPLPPGEQLGPVLSAAFRQNLVPHGIVPTPDDDGIPASAAKNLGRKGRVIKLRLDDADYDLVEMIRASLGLGKNQFAIQSINCRLRNRDPKAGTMFEGLRQVVAAIDGVLHTALACYIAASHGQMIRSREAAFLDRVVDLSCQIRTDGMALVRMAAGTAVAYAPDFMTTIAPLLGRVAKIKAQKVYAGMDLGHEVEAILRYLAIINIID
jgi:hypothetical protein